MSLTSPPAAILAAFLLTCLSAHAQEPVILPDPMLHTAVRTALGLPPTTPITPDLMMNLSVLHKAGMECFSDDDDDSEVCYTYPIKDLTGLELASNLSELSLTGPEHIITDLGPIKGLTRLKVLSLPQSLKATGEALDAAMDTIGGINSLTSLTLPSDNLENRHLVPLGQLTHLLHLDVSHNRLSDVTPLSALNKLSSLRLNYNQIADIAALENLTSLETLEVEGNSIADFSPLSRMQRLSEVRLGVAEKDLHSLPPLRRLHSLTTSTIDLGPVARMDQLQYIATLRIVADLTPLANLEHLTTFFSPGSPAFQDISPLRLAAAYRPNITSAFSLAAIDLSKPSNAATIEEWYRRGLLSRDVNLPQNKLWQPEHFIPDGILREFLSTSLGVPQDELRPEDLVTGRTQSGERLKSLYLNSGMRSFEGLQHVQSLEYIGAEGGWIADLTPLATIQFPNAYLYLQDNYINDVTPLVGKPFARLDLRGNPLNPATVPESWWTDSRVVLDPRRVLDPQQAIPDEGLRTAIRIALSLPVTAPVQASDLQGLEYLHAEGHQIQSLTGLESAVNLKGLAIRNNVVASLTPIANLPSLQWLRISGNILDTGATAIIALLRNRGVRVDDDASGRFLSSITPVNGVVYADAYQLSSLRYLQLFPEVRELFLSHNDLRDISILESLLRLERVHLSGNLLRLDPGAPAKATLTALENRGVVVTTDPQRPEASIGTPLADGALARAVADALELPVVPAGFTQAQLEAVHDLDWERTFPAVQPQLTHPELLRLMPNLTRLSLENAGLHDVAFLTSLTKLNNLDLDFNAITDLSPIAGLTSLTELDANNNLLENVAPLSSLTALESLDLDQNSIIDISSLASLTKLVFLDLHANKVGDLSPLSSLVFLQSLDLKANQIRNIDPLSGLTKLTELDLRYNRVASFAPLSTLTSLLSLDLQYNGNLLAPADLAVLNSLEDASPWMDLDLYPQFLTSPDVLISAEGLHLEWWGEKGVYYNVWTSENLSSWTYLDSRVGSGAIIKMPLLAPDQPSRFYRVLP